MVIYRRWNSPCEKGGYTPENCHENKVKSLFRMRCSMKALDIVLILILRNVTQRAERGGEGGKRRRNIIL